MTLALFGHPFSSYTMKVLLPLYESGTAFDFRVLAPDRPETGAAFAAVSPMGRFPVLVDGDTVVLESTPIVEYLDLRYPGPARLIPETAEAALAVRMLDRMVDNYVMAPMQAIVGDALRPDIATRDPYGVARARETLDRAYRWLEATLTGRVWAAGDAFSLADCAAAPALLYAHWVHPLPADLPVLRGYRSRLLARPSMARCIAAAHPYRAGFPLPIPAGE